MATKKAGTAVAVASPKKAGTAVGAVAYVMFGLVCLLLVLVLMLGLIGTGVVRGIAGHERSEEHKRVGETLGDFLCVTSGAG